MTIINKILGIFSIIASIIASVFIAVCKSEKAKNSALQEELETEKKNTEEKEKNIELHKKVEEDIKKEKTENEEKLVDALNGNTLDSFNALNDLLSK